MSRNLQGKRKHCGRTLYGLVGTLVVYEEVMLVAALRAHCMRPGLWMSPEEKVRRLHAAAFWINVDCRAIMPPSAEEMHLQGKNKSDLRL